MRRSNLSKVVSAGVISLSLAVLPSMSASAQTGDTNTAPSTTTTESPVQNVEADQGDRDFDWGWLGLLGLAGLAGLARKKEEPVRYRDPADPVPGRTNYNE